MRKGKNVNLCVCSNLLERFWDGMMDEIRLSSVSHSGKHYANKDIHKHNYEKENDSDVCRDFKERRETGAQAPTHES